ncbi:DUF4307 domain-containing protein [Nocardioides sp. JQ2195]|uniref:DUF4307 domain-containing protein n=1 Tax=Nocardioides sp. JQ2195 TaxID=2592334 RepID=UPI00143E3663|nr:DUF4307 domain-containing protein [Nocardioides sp. JQ2195]QIX27783.1 DUF4307 domain-containing protein [Nocardioides sp. JQ2195]
MSVDLSDRYGTNRSLGRIVVVGAAVLVVAFVGWLAWATWFHSTPEVTSELGNYSVVDAHTVEAQAHVRLEDDADASCKIRALADDHAVVGELNFTPVDGRNELTIRTERRATSVDLVGCTTDGQNRPR